MYDQITYGDEKEAHIGDNRFDILDYDFNDEMIIDEIYGNDDIYGGVIQNHHEDAVEVEIEWTFVYYDYKGYPIVRQDFKITTTEKIIINPNFNEERLFKAIIIGAKRFEDIKTEVLDQVYEYAKRESPKTTALIVGGRASGNRLLKNIDTDTYRIFYPANVKDPLRPVYVFLFTLLAIVTIGLVGSFLYTILHAVTKNVMAARQKDFAIYRSIGANKKDLGRLVIIEQVILSIFALILVIIAFNILSYYVLSIARIVDYLIWSDYIALFIIFAIFGALLGMRFNRKVFNQTVVETLSLAKEDIL
jgi:ABC-type antimicrobial peptide transport system permease subunit